MDWTAGTGRPPPNVTPYYAHTHQTKKTQPAIPNLIDGKLVPSKTDHWIELRNPATQELLGRVPQSTPEEVRRR